MHCSNANAHVGGTVPMANLHLTVGDFPATYGYRGLSWCSIRCMAMHLGDGGDQVGRLADVMEEEWRRSTGRTQ